MAGTITVVEVTTGKTVYCPVVNSSGKFWTGTGDNYETYNAAHWAAYAVAFTEGPARTYTATFPAAITTADTYSLIAYYQQGGSPATSDTSFPAGWGDMNWDGTKEIVPSSGGGTGGSLVLSMGIGI